MNPKTRCKWCNLKNPIYIDYHDNEWCKPNFDDAYLYEMLILESFQAGLSWECVYDTEKIHTLLDNSGIIRNKLKIHASITNSRIFKDITQEFGSFYNYLKTFTNDKILYETNQTTNALSDAISKDLKKRGMKYVGSTIIYSYLQAIGIIYSHDPECYLHKENL